MNETRTQKQDRKRREAQERNEAWQALTYDEKLKTLDERPGASKKQRHKLAKAHAKAQITS